MTVHTLKYIHQKRGYCKGVQAKTETTTEVKTNGAQPGLQKQTSIKPTNLSNEIVNRYIQDHPDTVNNYLRNERSMKAQRRQMNARSLLINTFVNM